MISYKLIRTDIEDKTKCPIVEFSKEQIRGLVAYLALSKIGYNPIDISLVPINNDSVLINTVTAAWFDANNMLKLKDSSCLTWDFDNYKYGSGVLGICLWNDGQVLEVVTEDIRSYLEGFLFFEKYLCLSTSVFIHEPYIESGIRKSRLELLPYTNTFDWNALLPELQSLVLEYIDLASYKSACSMYSVSKSTHAKVRSYISRSEHAYLDESRFSITRNILNTKQDKLSKQDILFIQDCIKNTNPNILLQAGYIVALSNQEIMSVYTDRLLTKFANQEIATMAIYNSKYIEYLLSRSEEMQAYIVSITIDANPIVYRTQYNSRGDWIYDQKLFSSFLWIINKFKLHHSQMKCSQNLASHISSIYSAGDETLEFINDYIILQNTIHEGKFQDTVLVEEVILCHVRNRKYADILRILKEFSHLELISEVLLECILISIEYMDGDSHVDNGSRIENTFLNPDLPILLNVILEKVPHGSIIEYKNNYIANITNQYRHSIERLTLLARLSISLFDEKDLHKISSVQHELIVPNRLSDDIYLEYFEAQEYKDLLLALVRNQHINYEKFNVIYDSYS